MPTSPSPAAQIAAGLFWTRLHGMRQLRRRGFKLWLAGALLVVGGLLLGGGTRAELGELTVLLGPPLLGLFFGTGCMRDEIQDQTLTYSFTRPLDRGLLYSAKAMAALGPALVIAVVAAVLAGATTGPATAARFAAAAALATLAYGALFSLVGLLIKWPTWVGLAYLMWESALTQVPGFLGQLSLLTHVRAVADLPVRGKLAGFLTLPSPGSAGGVLIAAAALALLAGGLIARRKEFRLER